MSFFYDLNKRLAGIGQEKKQVAESKQAPKSPARVTLEESLKHDLKTLMEDGTGGANFSGSGSLEEKAGYSAKKAAAGKDIGKPGKNFAKIEKSAGGGEKGKKIAGAVLAKLRAAKESVEEASEELADKDYDGDGKIETGKAEVMGSRMKAAAKAGNLKQETAKVPAPANGIPGNIPVPGKMERLRGERDYYEEADDNDEDIMDYLNRKLAPHDKQQQAKENAVARPYNKGTGRPDAMNGLAFEEESIEEAVSRKHFQQVADLLKNIPDEAKRKELAMHHASIFKQQNPRFDIVRFGQAAGVDLTECGMWEELKGGQKKLDVDGDGDIGADDLADLRSGKTQVADEGWDDAMALGKAAANGPPGTGKFDKRQTSTGTVYTRKPETFASDEEGDEPAVKRGRGRPAVAKGVERVTKGAWKHKGARANEGEEEVDEEKQEAGKRKFFDKLAPAAKKVAKVVGAVTKGKKEVDEEATDKEDKKAEKAGKKVAKDIEHDEGNKGKDDNKAEKAGKKVTKDIEYDDKKDKKEKKDDKKSGNPFAKKDKEEKVEETTTSGSVATATTSGKSSKGGINYGGSIYDSWNRQFETLLAESINISQESTKMEDGNEEEGLTIQVSGDDVSRFKELLANMGLGQAQQPGAQAGAVDFEEPCPSCGGVPCQCDDMGHDCGDEGGLPGEIEVEIDEADAPVSQNSPDYPTNQECDDDALQYSGGLNGPKSTGQTTIPVVASQQDRLRTMEESKESVDSFLNLYKAFKTK